MSNYFPPLEFIEGQRGGSGGDIVVDGDPGDWGGIAPLVTDVVGNDPPNAPEDFVSLRITNDRVFVYFLVEFANNIRTNTIGNLLAQISLDTDENTGTGCRFFINGQPLGVEFVLSFYGDSTPSFLGDHRDCGSTSLDFPGAVAEAIGGRFFEASVSIASLETITPSLNGFDFGVAALLFKNGAVRYMLK